MLEIVDRRFFKGCVVEQDLDAVGTSFFQALHTPVIEQVGQAAGDCGVVAGLFVCQQQASIIANLCCGKAVLGI